MVLTCRQGWVVQKLEQGWLAASSSETRTMTMMVVQVLAFVLASSACLLEAAQFEVGDSTGWSSPEYANLDRNYYSNWAKDKNFRVGDTLRFRYNRNAHNVLQVNESDYGSCTNSTPIRLDADGNTMVMLNRSGDWYFICGVPGHCPGGQKLSIDVEKLSSSAPTGSNEGSIPSGTGRTTALGRTVASVAVVFLVAW